MKPKVLYLLSNACGRVASRLGTLIDGVNLSRISEDVYLEVKMLRQEL